jgi:nuclear transport factor 2 (NTF2) superfamily protein
MRPDRVAHRFWMGWPNHGNEHREFESEGLMQRRDMSANDVPIAESDSR